MIAHSNVIAQCLQIAQITSADHTKVLAVLPLFHSNPFFPFPDPGGIFLTVSTSHGSCAPDASPTFQEFGSIHAPSIYNAIYA